MDKYYIYVSDLVKAIYSAAITEHTNQIYNIGSGKAYTLNQLLIKIRDVLKIDFNVQYMPSRPCDVPNIFLDCQLANKNLNWYVEIPLEEGILRTWDFIKK